MPAVTMELETRLGCLQHVTHSFSRSFFRLRWSCLLSLLSFAFHPLCVQPFSNQSSLQALEIPTLMQSLLWLRLLLLPRRYRSSEAVHWMLRYRMAYQLVMNEIKKRIIVSDSSCNWDMTTGQKAKTKIIFPVHQIARIVQNVTITISH